MKSKYLIPLISVFFILVSCNQGNENTETEVESPVSVENIKLKSIEQVVNTNGTVYPMQKVEYKSEIAGMYKLKVNPQTGKIYKLGDKVSAEQVIIEIEDKEYENQIAIESKRLNLELSKNEYEKQQSLYDKGGVTLRELRNSEVQYTNAKYDFENSKIKLEKMKISSPFDGVITDLPYYTLGVRMNTGQNLVTIMSYSKMYLEINLPEKAIAQVQPNQTVRITNYNLPGDTLVGSVWELSPAISVETRTFKGKLLINNDLLKLRPGMFVNADIITKRKDNTIVVSKEQVLTGEQGKYVFVVDKSAAKQRILTIGLETNSEYEVLEGLSENDRLVVKGFETLKDNSKVKVLK
jgi:RND family efflux transporter MFP subunit